MGILKHKKLPEFAIQMKLPFFGASEKHGSNFIQEQNKVCIVKYIFFCDSLNKKWGKIVTSLRYL